MAKSKIQVYKGILIINFITGIPDLFDSNRKGLTQFEKKIKFRDLDAITHLIKIA